MARKPSGKERYNFLLDRASYDDFSLICNELGMIRSRVIEKALQAFIKEHEPLLKELRRAKK